jgi:hypothetical protein
MGTSLARPGVSLYKSGREREDMEMERVRLLTGTVGATALAVIFLGARGQLQEAGPRVSDVSGQIAHGATVTIVGSGFGSKPSGPPLKWDTFEGGTPGTNLQGWDVDPAIPQYSSAVVRPNSTRSARAAFVGGVYASNFGIKGRSLPRIYFDAWYYYDAVRPYSRNHKLFRIHANTYSPNLYYNIYCAGVSASHLSQDGVDPRGMVAHVWISPTADYFSRRWVHLQGYFQESSPNLDDGVAYLWIDGVKHVDLNRFITRNTSSSSWDTLWFGNYLSHDSEGSCPAYGDAYTYWDDVYVDVTQARVEIGDASTYSSSRHREIQIPSEWSDTSIKVRLNRGSFQDLNGLYLYVVNANGNVSQGFPLSGTRAPASPTNLRILR